MSGIGNVREGMQVYGSDEQFIGTVERVHGDGFDVAGQHYSASAVSRVEATRVYLAGAGRSAGTEGEITVPVAEERLNVEKRETELGAVEVHKTVTEEQRTVPVELEREQVHVERVDVADRPVQPGEDVFQEGTIRVPVRGEEAVVSKEAVVTGEVVLNKEQTSERQTVADTVRKEQVEVAGDYREGADRAAAMASQTTGATTGAAVGGQGGAFDRTQFREGTGVVGSDNGEVGRIKEVRQDDFLVDRPMARDVYVPFSAVQGVNGNQVVLNVPSYDVDAMGWANPPLF